MRTADVRQKFRTSLPAIAVSAVLGLSVSTASGGPPAAGMSEDCFDVLENGKAAEIACAFPLRLTDTERADLKRITREYLHDLVCTMSIRIARAKVDEALRASDLVFQSPEQPVTCHVTTSASKFDVTATFAPRVVFKADQAIDATPGLANVKGVSRVLSWPVQLYVNRGPGMKTSMLQVVNAYRTYSRNKPKR